MGTSARRHPFSHMWGGIPKYAGEESSVSSHHWTGHMLCSRHPCEHPHLLPQLASADRSLPPLLFAPQVEGSQVPGCKPGVPDTLRT